jgi:hypothetical protein
VTEQGEGNGRRQAGTLAPDRLASTAKAMEVRHLTPVEQAEQGKVARTEVPRSTQAEIEFSKRRDAVGLLEASGIASARISADSVWANAGVAVCVLPRRCADHRDPGLEDVDDAADRAALRFVEQMLAAR